MKCGYTNHPMKQDEKVYHFAGIEGCKDCADKYFKEQLELYVRNAKQL